MGVKVTTTGNGRFVPSGDQSDVIIEYSVTESATPTGVANLAGEIPALTVSGLSNTVQTSGTTHPSSLLLIDNSITLTDEMRGAFIGRVGNISLDAQTVSADVYSIFEKLNVTKKVNAHNGTLKEAFEAYFAAAGLTSGQYSVDTSFSASVVFPGWNDNIWNSLKLLCVAVGAEMYCQSNVLYVKPRGTKSMTIENVDSESFSIELGEQAKTTKFTRNTSTWVTGAIVYAYGPKDSSESIEFGEKKEVILTTKISLTSVNQPEYTTTPFTSYATYIQPYSIGTVPSEKANGFYVFRDKNGYIVPQATATGLGAGVVASLTDNPYEIKLTITGPNIRLNTPWNLEFRDDYPALALTGTGALVKQETISFNTGSSIGDEDNEYSNNPFLVKDSYLYNTAYYTNQEICGPNVRFSFATDKIVEASNQEFGFVPGAIFSYAGSKYRAESVSYDYGSISIEAKQYVTFADFNTKWSGKTFAQFNSTMLDPSTYPDNYMKYSDLAIIPLMEPTA